MFDAIARRYDLLNHVLSVGLDVRWRAKAIREARLAGDARVLDLCTGTGDFAIAAVHAAPNARVVGVDFAGAMLRVGLDKLRGRELDRQIALVRGDATGIPVRDGWADAATIGFGIRNVAHPEAALAELARVIKPGGRLVILEFGEPIIPDPCILTGTPVLSSRSWAGCCPGTRAPTHTFPRPWAPSLRPPSPPPFLHAVSTDVRAVPLTLGVVYLYIATRG